MPIFRRCEMIQECPSNKTRLHNISTLFNLTLYSNDKLRQQKRKLDVLVFERIYRIYTQTTKTCTFSENRELLKQITNVSYVNHGTLNLQYTRHYLYMCKTLLCKTMTREKCLTKCIWDWNTWTKSVTRQTNIFYILSWTFYIPL